MAGGPRRAPDAPCPVRGNASRLFDLFRGPHFTLLAFGPVTGRYPDGVRSYHVDDSDLADTDGHIRRVCGGGFVLVRPDGYIGLVARHEDEVQEYLSNVMGVG